MAMAKAATTVDAKRNAAALLVNGAPLGEEFVVRLSGADRFQTAAMVSQRQFPAGGVDTAYITDGMKFPDALAGGALARSQNAPILLVANRLDGDVPSATAAELLRLNPQKIVVLGAAGAVTPATIENLKSYAATGTVEVIGGPDRFDTAVHFVDRDDRRLVDDDALAACIDAGVSRAKIDREIAGEERKKRAERQNYEPSWEK